MERLTTDKSVEEMSMAELACNCTFLKNGDSWYRDHERELRIRNLVRHILSKHETGMYDAEYKDDDRLDEYLQTWLQIQPEDNFYGIIAAFYNLAWSHAELRERLKYYEDLEENGRLLKLLCKPGDTVYIIHKGYTKCKYGQEFDESVCCGCEDEGCDSKKVYEIIPWKIKNLLYCIEIIPKIGKTVFLTEQEAQEALERMKVE